MTPVERALRLLIMLPSTPTLRLEEIAAELGVTTRQARRIIENLRVIGFVIDSKAIDGDAHNAHGFCLAGISRQLLTKLMEPSEPIPVPPDASIGQNLS